MNKEQKAAVVAEVATQIQESDAVFAVDYRGLSVTQAVDLRTRLDEIDAAFRVVKNRLTSRAADQAGAESLKTLLEGPTAFAFIRGDAALAAKAIATFRREHQLLEFKGGTMEGEPLTVDQLESIARLPARDVLQGQFVGTLAAPITGLVRGLGALVQGLALQLGQLQEQGLVGGGKPTADAPGEAAEPGPAADGAEGAADGAEGAPAAEAPGDPVAEAETAAEEHSAEAEGGPADSPGDDETSGEASASDDQPDASGEANAKED